MVRRWWLKKKLGDVKGRRCKKQTRQIGKESYKKRNNNNLRYIYIYMIKLRKSFKREIKNITKSVVNGRLSHMLTAAWKSDEGSVFFFCSFVQLQT